MKAKAGMTTMSLASLLLEQREAGRREAILEMEKQVADAYKGGISEVVEFINDLIIGIDGCKFEERLDGDKGCIVLDMNENQWQDFKRKRGME